MKTISWAFYQTVPEASYEDQPIDLDVAVAGTSAPDAVRVRTVRTP